MDFSPERFRRSLEHMGDPQTAVETIVIGGTNGKGSVSLLVSGGLAEAGFRVGTFLSPHLQTPHERFLDNLTPETEDTLHRFAAELEPIARRFELTYFEFLTLIVFVWAKEKCFDFLILEVGLGGRLDATNVTDPLASAITTIGLDHTQWLGDTPAKILTEKLGILRPQGLLFSGVHDDALVRQIEAACVEVDAVPYFSKEIPIHVEHVDWRGQSVRLGRYRTHLTNPSVGMAENAALAFLLLRIVFPKYPEATWLTAFSRVRNPGRFELVAEAPRVVLSGDHNAEGMQSMRATWEALGRPPLHAVAAFSPDKPHRAMFDILAEVADSIVLTQASRHAGQPAAYRDFGEFEPDPRRALARQTARAGSAGTVLVTGSLYLVGDLRPSWKPDVRFREAAPTIPAR